MTHRVNQDIQALRGVAILLVMLQHFRGRLPTSDGLHRFFDYFAFWGGVDLFFVISGFVICTSLMSNTGISSGKLLTSAELFGFLKRRFLRLAPASWFWIAASLSLLIVAPEMWPREWSPSMFLGHVSALTATANFYWSHCIHQSGLVMGSCTNPDVTSIYWSLSLEEQFYLVLAVCLALMPIRLLLPLMLGAAAAATIAAACYSDMSTFSLAWIVRPQGLVLGIFLAILAPNSTALTAIAPRIRLAAIGICVIAICYVSAAIPAIYSVPTIAVFAAIIVSLASLDGAVCGLPGRFLVWVGDRSYSIYLCHIVVYHLIRKTIEGFRGIAVFENVSNKETALWLVIAYASALGVGHLSFKFIERPTWLLRRPSTRATGSRTIG